MRDAFDTIVEIMTAIALVMGISLMLFLALFGAFVLLNLSVTGGWL